MKVLYRHIFVFVLIVAMSFDSLAQDRRSDDMSVRLAEYETLCRECLELKTKAAAGERVSRDQAQSLLDAFVAANRSLKDDEPVMTVAQRQRFAAVGRWFATGDPPRGTDRGVMRMATVPVEGLTGPLAEPLVWHYAGTSAKKYRSFYALADISIPDLAYGIMAGYQYGRIGGYIRFRSNFHKLPSVSYQCLSDGSLTSGGKLWSTGVSAHSTLTMTAGVLVPFRPNLAVYAGAGYGSRAQAWQDIDGSWALVADWSHKGFAADAGVVFSWRSLVLHAGVATIKFKTAAFTCGIGVWIHQ